MKKILVILIAFIMLFLIVACSQQYDSELIDENNRLNLQIELLEFENENLREANNSLTEQIGRLLDRIDLLENPPIETYTEIEIDIDEEEEEPTINIMPYPQFIEIISGLVIEQEEGLTFTATIQNTSQRNIQSAMLIVRFYTYDNIFTGNNTLVSTEALIRPDLEHEIIVNVLGEDLHRVEAAVRQVTINDEDYFVPDEDLIWKSFALG